MKRLAKKISDKIPVKGTKRNFLTLVSGTTFAQLFSILFYFVLLDLFSREDFGVFQFVSTVSSLIVVLASGKYEQAIIITRSRIESINVVSIAVFFSFIICSITLILMFFFSDSILDYAGKSDIKGWIYYSPIIAFLIVIYNCFNEWCVKKGAFSSLALNKITNSVSITLSKYGFGKIGMAGGLLHGELLGRGLSALSCVYHWVRVDRGDFKYISWSKMKRLSKRHIDFPKYTMPDNLVNTFTGSLPIFLLSIAFGDANLGDYSVTLMILSIPLTFIGQAISDVFRNRASIDFEKYDNCHEIYMRLFKKLVPFVLISLLGLIWFIPTIVNSVLAAIGKDDKWVQVGVFAQLMAPAIAFNLISNVFMSIWIIAGKQKQKFFWQLYYFSAMLIAVIIGCVIIKDLKIAVMCISIAYTLAYTTSIYYTWKYSKGVLKI